MCIRDRPAPDSGGLFPDSGPAGSPGSPGSPGYPGQGGRRARPQPAGATRSEAPRTSPATPESAREELAGRTPGAVALTRLASPPAANGRPAESEAHPRSAPPDPAPGPRTVGGPQGGAGAEEPAPPWPGESPAGGGARELWPALGLPAGDREEPPGRGAGDLAHPSAARWEREQRGEPWSG